MIKWPIIKVLEGMVHGKRWAKSRLINLKDGLYGLPYWIKARFALRKYYDVITVETLRERVTSDTVFIFGSGPSIADVTEEQWKEIEKHNTLGVGAWALQDFVRTDFYIMREIGCRSNFLIWELIDKEACHELFGAMKRNRHFKNSIYVVYDCITHAPTNYILEKRLIPEGAKVFPFTNPLPYKYRPPSTDAHYLTHFGTTVSDGINLAMILGWKNIVLMGVDGYDGKNFWNIQDTPHASVESIIQGYSEIRVDTEKADRGLHHTISNLAYLLGRWRPKLDELGINVWVYSPKSVLAERGTVPVYQWPQNKTS